MAVSVLQPGPQRRTINPACWTGWAMSMSYPLPTGQVLIPGKSFIFGPGYTQNRTKLVLRGEEMLPLLCQAGIKGPLAKGVNDSASRPAL